MDTRPLRTTRRRLDQSFAVSAWRVEVKRRVVELLDSGADREAQMDARRRVAGLERTEAVLRDCLRHRRRARLPQPRALVVHRSDWMRDRLADELAAHGITVVGVGQDGAYALAATLVEQPDVVLLEGLLPWVAPVDVVQDVHRFTPETVLAVQVEDPRAGEELLRAGATTVFSRSVRPAEMAASVVQVLQQSPGTYSVAD